MSEQNLWGSVRQMFQNLETHDGYWQGLCFFSAVEQCCACVSCDLCILSAVKRIRILTQLLILCFAEELNRFVKKCVCRVLAAASSNVCHEQLFQISFVLIVWQAQV